MPVARNPAIHSGMTVTAILQEPGNWQSLMWWKDHDMGQVALGGRRLLLARIAVLAPICLVGVAMLDALFRPSSWLAAGGGAVPVAYAVGQVLAIHRLIRARALLMEAGA